MRLFLIAPSLVLVAFIAGCSSNIVRTSGGFTPEIQPLPAQLDNL